MCPGQGEQFHNSAFKRISEVERETAVIPGGGKWLDIDTVHKFVDFKDGGLLNNHLTYCIKESQ